MPGPVFPRCLLRRSPELFRCLPRVLSSSSIIFHGACPGLPMPSSGHFRGSFDAFPGSCPWLFRCVPRVLSGSSDAFPMSCPGLPMRSPCPVRYSSDAFPGSCPVLFRYVPRVQSGALPIPSPGPVRGFPCLPRVMHGALLMPSSDPVRGSLYSCSGSCFLPMSSWGPACFS
jgi:hypothetical protein